MPRPYSQRHTLDNAKRCSCYEATNNLLRAANELIYIEGWVSRFYDARHLSDQ